MNNIPGNLPTHTGWTKEEIRRILGEIEHATGFTSFREIARRTIYTADHVWRVRMAGEYRGKPASLVFQNLKLETEEESLRRMFAAVTDGRVRPPETYHVGAFDEARGYGYSIDELVQGESLFDPAGSPALAADRFFAFYRRYRETAARMLVMPPTVTTQQMSEAQLESWRALSERTHPTWYPEVASLAERLQDRLLDLLTGEPLLFQHPHLAGADVRCLADGSYVVFANQYWSWRQPAYDAVFPLWTQWLARPPAERTPEGLQAVTEAWRHAAEVHATDLVPAKDLAPMLLNRLYGSLLLDLPAKAITEGAEAVMPLVIAFRVEAERLLAE